MDKIIELAKQAGAVSYTNRHYHDRPYRTFGPEELSKFYTLARADLEAENAKLRKALSPFVLANSSEEHMTLIVRTADITTARAALGEK